MPKMQACRGLCTQTTEYCRQTRCDSSSSSKTVKKTTGLTQPWPSMAEPSAARHSVTVAVAVASGPTPLAPLDHGADERLWWVTTAAANCGATQGLMRCSRCKNIWFCSLKCHKAYWPVHRSWCRANDFAAVIESTEPKFAAFLRNHGKQAVLKDAEVERLERASQAASGSTTRQEVLESMYGRADPKPNAPSYSSEEWLAMEQRRQREAAQAALLAPQDKAWAALPDIRPGFGRDCGTWRWSQDMSKVEVVIKLPGDTAPGSVRVDLTSRSLRVTFGSAVFLEGELCRLIDVADSTWFVDLDTGLLHMQLQKRSRKGRYLLPAAAAQLEQQTRPPLPQLLAPAASHTLNSSPHSGSRQGDTLEPRVDLESHAGGQRPESVARPATAADTYWHCLLQGQSDYLCASTAYAPAEYYVSGSARDAEE